MKPFSLFKLVLPFTIFIIFFLVFIFLNEKNQDDIDIGVGLFGFSLNIPISLYWIKKISILTLSIFSLLSYIFFDFSQLFPSHLSMEVFFDSEGIDKCLGLYTVKELNELHIITNDIENYQMEYYETINIEAMKILKTPFFTLNRKDIHSEGKTSIIAEKVKGIQNYHIKESKGELTHLIEREKMTKKEFYTFFEKISSADDTLSLSFRDIVISNRIFLKTRYKQIITQRLKEKGKVFNHVLCGYTILSIFPLPNYSNTIYLLEKANVGLIPIGYAIYREV